MTKLKFETEDTKFGLTKASGFIWYDETGIHIEYQVSDNVFELYKSKVHDVFIPFSDVQKIHYKKPWMSWFAGGTVYVMLNNMKKMNEIPFMDENKVCINLKRNQISEADEFAVNAQLELSTYRLNELDL